MKTRLPRDESDASGPHPVGATGCTERRREVGDPLMAATRPSVQHCFGDVNTVRSAFTCSSRPDPSVRQQSTIRWGAPTLVDPTLADPTLADPTLADSTLADPTLVNPESGPRSPTGDMLP